MRSSTIHNSPFTIHSANAGFSIIEATLAVVVVAAGVISIFLLFSAGLDLGSPSVGDTTCAMFADSVLNGLRAESERAARQGRWLEFWEDFVDGYTNIPVAVQGVWEGSPVIWAGGVHTNSLTNYPLHSYGSGACVVGPPIRYRITVELEDPLYYMTNRADVTLKVWPNDRGPARDNDALIFYTEFRDNGAL